MLAGGSLLVLVVAGPQLCINLCGNKVKQSVWSARGESGWHYWHTDNSRVGSGQSSMSVMQIPQNTLHHYN